MEKRIFEAVLNEFDEESGIYAVSLVDQPAILKNFVFFGKESEIKFKVDSPKRIVSGPLLVPNQLIYRKAVDGYVYFTKQEIEKIRNKMMLVGDIRRSATLMHQKPVNGVKMVECWVAGDNLKKTGSGFKHSETAFGKDEVPAGSLMVSYKIESDYLWHNFIANKKVQGFSLEGLFDYKLSNFFKNMETKNQKTKEPNAKGLSQFFRSVASLLSSESDAQAVVEQTKKDEIDAGKPYLIFVLADGTEVQVDAEGLATTNGTPLAAGDYELDDGNFITIDDAGKLVVSAAEPSASGQATEAEMLAAKERGKALITKMGKQKPASKDESLEAQVTALRAELEVLKKTPKSNATQAQSTEFSAEKPGNFANRVGKLIGQRYK